MTTPLPVFPLHVDSPTFRIVCDQSWDALAPRSAIVRFCARCERDVHACGDPENARRLSAAGSCVALTHEVARRRTRPLPTGKAPRTVTVGQLADGDFPVVGWLVVLDGPMRHLTVQLGETITTIGAAPPADLVLPDDTIAALHVELRCERTGFLALDRSGRGFIVNEQSTSEQDLVDGDVLLIGATHLVFKSAA
jgi:hypothetical protein